MDGIDPEMVEKFEGRIDEDLEGEDMGEMVENEEIAREVEEEMDEEEAAMRARNIVRVRPMQVTIGEQQGKKRVKVEE